MRCAVYVAVNTCRVLGGFFCLDRRTPPDVKIGEMVLSVCACEVIRSVIVLGHVEDDLCLRGEGCNG